MDQETGFCRPYRSPGWSSWLPTSILSNPYHCGHLGSEPADSMWSLSQISNFNVTYWMSVKAGVVHMKRRGWKQELTPNQQDISGIRENLSSIYPQCSRLFFWNCEEMHISSQLLWWAIWYWVKACLLVLSISRHTRSLGSWTPGWPVKGNRQSTHVLFAPLLPLQL